MRVKIDPTVCQAHAQCVMIAPEVFALNDAQDVAIVLQEFPPESLHDVVLEAVSACPVQAISVTED